MAKESVVNAERQKPYRHSKWQSEKVASQAEKADVKSA
jgi:thioester reductase-like protein